MRKMYYLASFRFVKDAWEMDLKLCNPQHALQSILKLCMSSYPVSFPAQMSIDLFQVGAEKKYTAELSS